MKIAGIVLGGGQSRRMGGIDKGGTLLGGRTLLQHAIARLEPQVEAIAVNTPEPTPGYAHAPDTVAGQVGPLAGVLAGMEWARSMGATHLATAATDTPFAPTDWVMACAEALTGKTQVAMAASDGRIHPVFSIWPVSLADDLHHFLTVEDKRKIIVFAERHGLAEVTFETGAAGDPFFNINTPDDLTAAKARIG